MMGLEHAAVISTHARLSKALLWDVRDKHGLFRGNWFELNRVFCAWKSLVASIPKAHGTVRCPAVHLRSKCHERDQPQFPVERTTRGP